MKKLSISNDSSCTAYQTRGIIYWKYVIIKEPLNNFFNLFNFHTFTSRPEEMFLKPLKKIEHPPSVHDALTLSCCRLSLSAHVFMLAKNITAWLESPTSSCGHLYKSVSQARSAPELCLLPSWKVVCVAAPRNTCLTQTEARKTCSSFLWTSSCSLLSYCALIPAIKISFPNWEISHHNLVFYGSLD